MSVYVIFHGVFSGLKIFLQDFVQKPKQESSIESAHFQMLFAIYGDK